FFASRRRHTRFKCDWSSDVCSPICSSFSGIEHDAAGERTAAARQGKATRAGHRQLAGTGEIPAQGGRAANGDRTIGGDGAAAGEIGRGACREGGGESVGGR